MKFTDARQAKSV